MRKKLIILFLLLFIVFPSKILAYEQGTVTCIYNDNATYGSGRDSWKNFLNVTFYGVGTTMPTLGEIEYYSIYNNDLNDKRIIFSYENNSMDYFINYNTFIPGFEAQYRYASSIIISDISQGTKAITEANQELVCPKQMLILEYTEETGKWNPFVANEIKSRYDLYACGNNYGDYNNDTCPITKEYLREYRKTANHDGTAGKMYTMSYYTGSLISNVGQKDPTHTNVQDVYNDTQEKIEDICKDDENNDIYDAEECQKLLMQQGSNVNQAETNLGTTEEELEKGYGEFKAQTNIEFNEASCNTLLGDTTVKGEPAYYLNFAFNLMKYAAIVLLLVLTIIEYAKAVASSNQDAIKKATTSTVKRLIIAMIIFLLPILINFVLRLLGIISTNGTCGIGI